MDRGIEPAAKTLKNPYLGIIDYYWIFVFAH
jgi:hypothetical protein